MDNAVLVVNAGSSSIKFSIFVAAADRSLSTVAYGQVEGIGIASRLSVLDSAKRKLVDRAIEAPGHDGAIAGINAWFASHFGAQARFAGVGHRVVHGGVKYSSPVLIDDRVLVEIESLVPLAPLHQPHEVSAIRAFGTVIPGVPQVACFDTAFHRSQPAVAQEFALPHELTASGVRRYGFHGLSYEYIVSVLPSIAPSIAAGKVIVAHLGNGASMCAIDGGRSVATTMGLTALDGLPMGTRIGAVDPGVILYLMQDRGMNVNEVEDLLYRKSGLLGVSGVSSDVRTLLASDAPSAAHAIELFVYRAGREIGSLAAALGGLDALVFTGGIGENAISIRGDICRAAGWLGIELDDDANAGAGPCISIVRSKASAWVIPTNENLMIARHTRRLVDS